MAQIVRNVGEVSLNVAVIKSDGSKGTFRLMPKNKGVTLTDGSRVDPYWLAMEGADIRIFNVDTVISSSQDSDQPVNQSSAANSQKVQAPVAQGKTPTSTVTVKGA